MTLTRGLALFLSVATAGTLVSASGNNATPLASVKLTAIWETERNTILFYGSSGERTAKTQLEAAPRLEHASLAPASLAAVA